MLRVINLFKEITLAKIAALSICLISMMCNYRFGVTLSLLIGCLFVASEILKSQSLACATNNLNYICPVKKTRRPRYTSAMAALLLFLICTVASLVSGYSFFVLQKNNSSSSIEAIKEDYRLTLKRQKSLEQNILD